MVARYTPSDRNGTGGSSRTFERTAVTAATSRRRLLHVLGAGGVAGLAGCSEDGGPGTEPTAGTATEPETKLRESITIGHTYSLYGSYWSLSNLTQTYQELVTLDHELREAPLLVKDWERTGENTWELSLRENVTYHNGDRFHADPVISRFNSFLTQESWLASPEGVNTTAEGIEKVDDMTIEMTTIDPDANQPMNLTGLTVFGAHPDSSGGIWDIEDYSDLIATGPYQFEEVKEGQHVKLSAFDEYWGGDPETSGPHIENVTIRSFDDRNTLALALAGQELDLALDLPVSQFESIKNAQDTKVASQPRSETSSISINMEIAPTADVKLRKALNFGLSQEKIVEATQNGFAIPGRGPLPPMLWWASYDSLPAYEVDKAKAKRLVDESDYNGETLEYVTMADEPRSAKLIGQLVQSDLKEIGVDIEIQSVGSSSYSERREAGEGHLFPDSLELNFMGEFYDAVFRFGSPSEEYPNDDPQKPVNQPRQEVRDKLDPLLREGRQNTGDARKEPLQKVQQIIMEEALMVPLFHQEFLIGMRNGVEEIDWHPVFARQEIENLKYFE